MPVETKLIEFKTNLDPTPKAKIGHKERYDGEWSGSTYSEIKSSVSANVRTLKTEFTSEDHDAKLTTEGPGLGGELGISTSSGVAAMVEARVAQVTGEVGPLYASAGLNANTGVKLGDGGLKVAVLGFGFNFGVGGKFSVDTPVGSLGASTLENTHQNENTNEDLAMLRHS